jgi:hypothetical protein
MKAYVITTGTIFVLITVAHVWRMVVEPSVATEPAYLALTVVAAGLGLWAWQLLRRPARP